jgi:hypothetical protein
LDHHDDIDSSTRQSKGLGIAEVRHYRDELYRTLKTEDTPTAHGDNALESLLGDGRTQTEFSENLRVLHEPWRFTWLVEGAPELFAYKSPNGFDGICRIERVNLPDDRAAIICEDIDGNPGMSTTNAIEYIALQLCEQLEIEPELLVLIEHYDTWFADEEEWNLVQFKQRSMTEGFAEPSWHPLSAADWAIWGMRPRLRRNRRGQPQSLVIRTRPVRGG